MIIDTTKTTISQDDYLRVIGLLKLANDHTLALKDIEKNIAELVGAPDEGHGYCYFGHVSDAICESYSAHELLDKMGIKIQTGISVKEVQSLVERINSHNGRVVYRGENGVSLEFFGRNAKEIDGNLGLYSGQIQFATLYKEQLFHAAFEFLEPEQPKPECDCGRIEHGRCHALCPTQRKQK